MTSRHPIVLALVAQALLAAAPLKAAGIDPARGLLCTAEDVRNESTGQILAAIEPIFHAPEQLRQDGDFYLRSEVTDDDRESMERQHRINRLTGAFETVSMQTVHEVGEQYLIRITGTCKPADHTALAQRRRY